MYDCRLASGDGIVGSPGLTIVPGESYKVTQFLACLAISATGLPWGGQVTQEVQPFYVLTSALEMMAVLSPRIPSSGISTFSEAANDARYLKELSERLGPPEEIFSRDFTRSLQYDLMVYEEMAEKETLSEQDLSLIEGVSLDISVKAAYMLKRNGAVDKPVPVTVRTWHGATEVDGQEVWYATVGEYLSRRGHHSFPGYSKVSGALTAGQYVMWVQDPVSGKKASTREIGIGLNGNEPVVVDLQIPKRLT